jgi:hypothetical protein
MNLRSIALGILALVASWLAISQLAWWIAEAIGGYALAEDSLPYANAHLIEEAIEGTYSPVRDARFLLGSVFPTGLAFAISGFWFGRASWRSAALLGLAGGSLLTLLHRQVLMGLPASIGLPLFFTSVLLFSRRSPERLQRLGSSSETQAVVLRRAAQQCVEPDGARPWRGSLWSAAA